jgi:hypothetical protein
MPNNRNAKVRLMNAANCEQFFNLASAAMHNCSGNCGKITSLIALYGS